MTFGEPFLLRHPWIAALLLGTVATPAAVILAVPAPRPLDAILAWPLVLMDSWLGSPATNPPVAEAGVARLLAVAGALGLTWLHYVLLARVAVWRVATVRADAE